MRTTVTLDPDTRLLIDQVMRDRGLSFREAVNELIRRGSSQHGRVPTGGFTTSRAMGEPTVPLTRALDVADRLEDEEIAHRLAAGR